MIDWAETSYVRSRDGEIAYKVTGDGDLDILYVPAWTSNQDNFHAQHVGDDFWQEFLTLGRLITYDQRGSGLSDPADLSDPPTLETWADDLHAVLDAAGTDQVVLLGMDIAAPLTILYAATHSERVRSVVLVNGFARLAQADDYPFGFPRRTFDAFVDEVAERWGTGEFLRSAAPHRTFTEEEVLVMARVERQAMHRAGVRDFWRMIYQLDVREVLPHVHAPTLVLHTARNPFVPLAHGRYLAEHIPGARLVELPGGDVALSFSRTGPAAIADIREFLTGSRVGVDTDRLLTTLLFSDVVDSTARARELGDRAWKALLDRHDAMVERQLARFGGVAQKHTGDGVLATFDGTARAVRAGCAIRDGARQLGIDVRVGVHTGEVERRGQELAGVALHFAQRVSALGGRGDVLVSRIVTDLVAGSGIEFEPRGSHVLKGFPGEHPIFAVAGG